VREGLCADAYAGIEASLRSATTMTFARRLAHVDNILLPVTPIGRSPVGTGIAGGPSIAGWRRCGSPRGWERWGGAGKAEGQPHASPPELATDTLVSQNRNEPPLSELADRIESQISIWFSQEACVGA
jgi:hypothetical protein